MLRHGGRGGPEQWRVIGSKPSQQAAEVIYQRKAAELRQGALVLWHQGEPLKWISAPRLRTRW